MKCELCEKLIEINGFGGYLHFESTKNAMNENVKNGYMKVVSKNSFETIFECCSCRCKWRLAAPDFPAVGYLICEPRK